MVHEVAAAGFNDAADYEAARPSYPQEAVDWFVEKLHIAPESRVCDLAAGTGKLTRLLTPTGAWLVACEPVPGMRAVFRAAVPGVPLVAGTSEALPFRAGSLDAIVVAQAWHWFDHERAIAEARRALKAHGSLGIVWNARERSEAWVNEVWSIMDRVEKHAPWRDHENWRESAIAPMPGFGEVEIVEFRHFQDISVEDMVRRVASVSHVAVLPEAEKAAVLGEVRHVIATHPDTAGRETLQIPYRVDCFATTKT